MDNSGIQLFKKDNNKIALPSNNIQEHKELMSESIKETISAETVKVLILPETAIIDELNFIFDFSKTETITVFQREALKSLISKNGDVTLYLYRTNGLVEFGKGDKYLLERVLPLVSHFIFGDEVIIYKNYKIGEKAVKLAGRDVGHLRLNL